MMAAPTRTRLFAYNGAAARRCVVPDLAAAVAALDTTRSGVRLSRWLPMSDRCTTATPGRAPPRSRSHRYLFR
jgi:hypothetical protein